jgi:hypothetical protein
LVITIPARTRAAPAALPQTLLAVHTQRSPARDQHLDAWAGRQQRGVEHLLEVAQQQQAAREQVILQRVDQRAAVLWLDMERFGDRRED